MRLLTPRVPGGVAVVAVARAEREVLAGLVGAAALESDVPRLVRVRDPADGGGGAVDEALLVNAGPAGWELHLHGSEAVLARLERAVGAALAPCVDPACPAERLMRTAIDDAQLALALEQRGLDFEATLTRWMAMPVDGRAAEARAALARSSAALALVRPQRLVLAGRQNAGKSTLMNRLLFRERVLAGPSAGLTRDPVAEVAVLGGYPYLIVDTAGEGPAVQDTDRRAVETARKERAVGLVIAVVDRSRGPDPADSGWIADAALVVATHADRPAAPWGLERRPDLEIRAADPAAAVAIRQAVGARLAEIRGLPRAGPAGGIAALDDDQVERLRSLAR